MEEFQCYTPTCPVNFVGLPLQPCLHTQQPPVLAILKKHRGTHKKRKDIVGSRDSQRLGSPSEPNLSTPLESGVGGQEATAMPTVMPPRARTPPFYHVQLSQDTRSLVENGFGPNWINDMSTLVVDHLNQFGLCVLEGFFGEARADKVLTEVLNMHDQGIFRAGQVVSRQVQEHAREQIRGDKIAWVTGSEPNCHNIGQLAKLVDAVILRANNHPSAGKLAEYNIKWRTKAMVACYPGRGARYVRHMDNPNGDGRCITAIYYINKDWEEQHGGILRIYPEDNNEHVANIEPRFDRMLFFWSDRRNPHEVLPSNKMRYAITIWYLDQKEREEYLSQENTLSGAT
ncbi:HIF prolyl hydroxylase isoform X2 [Oratosquilla oratoria]|uniref:HIF prolyl hydroxylase isoform X2 n=1 Tax=Oratosquilla oratoria TaxID=337810 RepID=UPI003F762EA0